MANDTRYETFQHYGTDAARIAFTPSPAAGIQPIYIWYATDTGFTWIYDTSWHQVAGAGAGTNVTAAAVLTDDRTIRGDGGVRGSQTSLMRLDDAGGSFGLTRLAIGSGATLEDYTAVYAGSTAYFVGNIQAEITDFTNDYTVGFNAAFSMNPSGTVTIPVYAVAGILWTDAGDANDFAQLLGVYGEASHYGSGDSTGGVRGLDGWGVNSGSGQVGTAAQPNTGTTAVFAEGWGVDNGGTALYASAFYARAPLCAGGGAAITEADAIRIADVDVAGITTARVFKYDGTGTYTIDKDSNQAFTAYVDISEITAPAAPAANTGRLYVDDTGGGKSRLNVRFASGAVQVIATEP